MWWWLLLVACDGEPTPTPTEPAWYTTCGDPACGGYTGPIDGVGVCPDIQEGEACDDEGARCDLQTDCNQLMICAVEDPKDQPGGCPISRRAAKKDIHYLSPAELDAVRAQALDLPLATWRYREAADGSPARLGFIIDDRPHLPAVSPDGGHVDVYGLASMALATIQAQEREIAALRARVEALERAAPAR